MSTAWIIPSSPDVYKSDDAFNEMSEITWSETGPGIQLGDTVYLYLSSPVSAIGTKCLVVATGLPTDEIIDDQRHWTDPEALTKRQAQRSWMVLRRSVIFDRETRAQLTLEDLRSHGLRGTMAGRQRVPNSVLEYIREIQGVRPSDDALAESSDINPNLVRQYTESIEAASYAVEDRRAQAKTRGSAQRAFADVVKANYGFRCAITGITTPAFLVASHIVPWAEDETTRLDPANGICLSTLVDRAFDAGYLMIDENSVVHINRARINDDALVETLIRHDGQKLATPIASAPNLDYLRRRLALRVVREPVPESSATQPLIRYARVADIPPNVPISLTEIDPGNGYLADYGDGMYCSICGKNSARRARTDLWAIRHKTQDDLPGPLWTYCSDHLPDRDWQQGESHTYGHGTRQMECTNCFLIVSVGSICDQTGQVHSRS